MLCMDILGEYPKKSSEGQVYPFQAIRDCYGCGSLVTLVVLEVYRIVTKNAQETIRSVG